MSAFRHGIARLPDNWIMRRGLLNETHYDSHGWFWGPGDPIFILNEEGIDDTLSVRAPCPVIAIALITIDRWPPRSSKRFNWEYKDAIGR